ncbi:MAG: hypothetical protein V3W18_08390 [candidate division Zixibacteria bacterium]
MIMEFKPKKIVLLVTGLFCLCFMQALFAIDSQFRLAGPVSGYSMSHDRYLGVLMRSSSSAFVEEWYRRSDPKLPGDYFIRPQGADSISLTDEEQAEIRELLEQNVNNKYYDQFVIESIAGYQYSIADSLIPRREYYLKYAREDTVFAISGWLGKFFSFYKVVPGDFRYDTVELQIEASKISSSYRSAKRESFRQLDDEYNYLLEYIDRPNKMRIRNYQIGVRFSYGVSDDQAQTYNLIEITKFIDPEVIP